MNKRRLRNTENKLYFGAFFAFYFPFFLNSCIVEISNRERNDVL